MTPTTESSSTPVAGQEMSVAQFMAMPATDGERHELVNGKLRTMPPAGHEHGEFAMEVGRHIANWAKRSKAGKTYAAETGFLLREGTVRAPDAAFVNASRLPVDRTPGRSVPFPGAPDLAVEVLSEAASHAEVIEKIEDFLAAGTSQVWVMIPHLRVLEVHLADGTSRRLHDDDTLDGGATLPGFSLRVRDLWDA